jgi:hypothetical protein
MSFKFCPHCGEQLPPEPPAPTPAPDPKPKPKDDKPKDDYDPIPGVNEDYIGIQG